MEEGRESGMGGERTLLYREALNEALGEEMRRDASVFILGEDIAERGGSFHVTEGLLAEFGPGRVIDTPIAEAGFTGVGFGAAVTGMRPVIELSFIDFTLLTLDQIVNQIAKYHFMTGGNRTVPLVIRTQGGVGEGLAAQHSQSLEAIFHHIPGLRIAVPSCPADAKGLLKTAIRADFPVIFIEHKRLYATGGPVPDGDHTVPLGSGHILREGDDVTVIAWSGMVSRALEAADTLAREGIGVTVVDPRTLVPLDTNLILTESRRTGRVVIAQEAVRRGGVASDIATLIHQEAFGDLRAPVDIVAGLVSPVPFARELEQECIPSAADIAEGVRRTFAYR